MQVLRKYDGFHAWPLDMIVPDVNAFFTFLQERWPVFLNGLNKTKQIKENSLEYGLKFPGPMILPFDHQDIKVYIDTLFVEGKLAPVSVSNFDVHTGSWIRCGIICSNKNDEERISRLFKLVSKICLQMNHDILIGSPLH